MITAVDTNVLLDIFTADATFGASSRETLRKCRSEGRLIASDVVWAEVAAAFPDVAAAGNALKALGVDFIPLGESEASSAGKAWHTYRRAGGPRDRVIADFLVGAHAGGLADRLMTRDRGFYRRYFATLSVLDPSAPLRRPSERTSP